MASLIESKQKVTVLKWTEELCRCLEAQYRNYSLKYVMDSQNGNDKYLQERATKIENDEECIKFTISTGKKYHKIIQNDFRNGKYESAGVHAFVDKKTGEVYKPASWKAPAKHVRFDMRDERQLKFLLDPKNVGWAGGYLYLR